MGWLWGIIKWIFGRLFGASDSNTAERQAGEKLGQQETENTNAQGALDEVQKAVAARDGADPGRVRNPNDPAARPYRDQPD